MSYNLIARDMEKSIARVAKQPTVDRETDYYRDNIGKVTTIDEFVKNDRLFRYAMKAHGLSDMAYAKAFMVKVLKEGISDPDSFANKLTDKRYAEFATTYNFEKHGALATTYSRVQNDTPSKFEQSVALGTLQGGFAYARGEVANYASTIGSVKTIDDLLGNDRLLAVAMAAYGLDAATEDPATVRQMLEGGVSDPQSPANQLPDKRYANFVAAFDFARYGTETTARPEVQGAGKAYVVAAGLNLVEASPEFIKAETDYFKANIGKAKTIDALIGDKRLLRVAMNAFGLDADVETEKTIRTMLAGGVTDPQSPANKLSDKSYANFVAAFDFVTHGTATTGRATVMADVATRYSATAEAGLISAVKYMIATETAAFKASVAEIGSIDELMANRRVLNYALAAYGLDPAKETPARIREMLSGGIKDAKSPANTLTEKNYQAFVTAFNFAEYGEETTTRSLAMEPSIGKYLRQTLEEDAGQSNEGVRLALYFDRKASSITNVYQILADPALSQVVRSALGIPETMAAADIDKQAAMIEKKLKIADLQDPDEVAKFLTKFTSMWELSNGTSSAMSAASVLFAQSTSYGVSTDLLLTMQKMRL